jgi:hypothetical protein
MLEVLTAQVFHGHLTQFGKGFTILRNAIKRHIESHAPPSATEINILIISDLLYGDLKSGYQSGVIAEGKTNPGTNILLRMSQSLVANVVQHLHNSSVSGRWLKSLNGASNDPGNFDLHALYTLLGDLDTGTPGLKWNVHRTVFTEPAPQSGLVGERTAFGVSRTSYFWDSNDKLRSELEGKYDVILMRRGLCYCDQVTKKGFIEGACCGAARGDDSDVAFLEKVQQALRKGERSAAYLAGWNGSYRAKDWATALGKIKGGTLVPCYAELKEYDMVMNGIFLSRGRAMSKNVLKV